MRKRVHYYLFAVLCAVCSCFLTSCDDDDDGKKNLTTDDIVGVYSGEMDIEMLGNKLINDLVSSITVRKSDGSKVTLSLANFTIPGLLPTPVDITAECSVTPSTSELKLNGNATLDLSGLGMEKTEIFINGEADGHELEVDITVIKMGVTIEFDGRK